MNHIITSRHYAEALGVKTTLERIKALRDQIHKKRRIAIEIKTDAYAPDPVQGFIENGQWLAKCECGGCEFVDPDEPIFFCFSCANRAYGNRLREVAFPDPDTRREIERLVLLRPVNDARGLNDMERAGMAVAKIFVEIDGGLLPLTRSWNPGETLEDLHAQQDAALAAWEAEHGV